MAKTQYSWTKCPYHLNEKKKKKKKKNFTLVSMKTKNIIILNISLTIIAI